MLGSGGVLGCPWFGWHGCLTQAASLQDGVTECWLGCSGQERFMCVLSMMDMLACRGIGHALRPCEFGAWMVPVHGGYGLCGLGRKF